MLVLVAHDNNKYKVKGMKEVEGVREKVDYSPELKQAA